MRLNVVNISNFFLLSGEILAESKYSKGCNVESESNARREMNASSFKLDQNLGIIQGRFNRGCNLELWGFRSNFSLISHIKFCWLAVMENYFSLFITLICFLLDTTSIHEADRMLEIRPLFSKYVSTCFVTN